MSRLPLRRLSALQEEEDRFYATAVLDAGARGLRIATVTWLKLGFDAWWDEQKKISKPTWSRLPRTIGYRRCRRTRVSMTPGSCCSPSRTTASPIQRYGPERVIIGAAGAPAGVEYGKSI